METGDVAGLTASAAVAFSQWLRQEAGPAWSAATRHPFTDQLADGTLPDDAMRRYLVQDYAFIETLVTFVAYGVANAPTMQEKRVLSAFLGVLTGGENDYFQRSFAALGIDDAARREPLNAAASDFRRLLLDTGQQGRYEEILTVLTAAEWIYLDWAMHHRDAKARGFYHREWIDLHNSPAFQAFVRELRRQLDELGPHLSQGAQRRCARLFRETAELEVRFFDAALSV